MHHFGAKIPVGAKTCTILVQKKPSEPKHAPFWCKVLQSNNTQSGINRAIYSNISMLSRLWIFTCAKPINQAVLGYKRIIVIGLVMLGKAEVIENICQKALRVS